MRKLIPALFMAALLLVSCSQSETLPLDVQDVWARPAAAGQNSAVYLTVLNPNQKPDNLIGVSVTVAEIAELHQTTEDSNEVMSMHPQHAVEIPAGEKTSFEPGGLHIMLVGLKQDLKPGDTFDLTLDFQNAGSLTFPATVKEQ